MVMGKCRDRAKMNHGFLAEIRAAVANKDNKKRSGRCSNTHIPTGVDPMTKIVANDPQARKRAKKTTTFVNKVSRIRMPECPEEDRKGRHKIMRDVSVYLEKTNGGPRLWIHLKDLEWLVRSLWIYQQLGGVADVGSDDGCTEDPKRMEPDLPP